MSTRKDKLREAIQQAKVSLAQITIVHREQALAHNAYNSAMTEAPAKGRRSGTDLENLRLHAVTAYEALLDAMRIHHDNLAHLAALKGKLT
ncbi:hypothetical protein PAPPERLAPAPP_00490 [Brevundimonas phage vB_BpoS-Papperlapapp]|uniref:Uncharacterized protein n=1 Tax=Brevundimonas phage vB_BpoS-Domovoi TaxID=2948598 RepID=A0A9E7MSN1_9CAUD|nr:hypothetical protein DOMOVOI_05260 [Brevundimonas phage vB_BpoS-Domovoi]USN15791.1 hypothetical protein PAPPERLAPAPP_00490 [Brevundimonas phage vB_BpoS-Papperlapapp]